MNFGEVLKGLRKEARLTQQQLGNQVGVSKSVISFYELRLRSPSPTVLVKLAAIFHVSTDYLLGLDKVKRLDVTGLDEEDIDAVSSLIKLLRKKNQNQKKKKSR